MINKCLKLYKKYEEIVNYIIVGGLTTGVSLGVKWLLLFTFLDSENAIDLQISVIMSWIAAVTFAYVANKKIVFKSECDSVLKEIVSFYLARVCTLGIEMILMWFFVTLLKLNTDLWVLIITIALQFIIMVLNYIFSKVFVFKKKV